MLINKFKITIFILDLSALYIVNTVVYCSHFIGKLMEHPLSILVKEGVLQFSTGFKLNQINMKRFNEFLRLLCAIFRISNSLLVIQGCKSDEVVTQASDNTEISMMSSPGVTDQAPINALVLDSVKVLIKNIKLNVSAASDDSVNFKTGPFVVKLNLNSSVNLFTTAMIPEGTYDKIKFEIHKLEDGEVGIDTAFSFAGGRYSVVVYGKFNLIPFIYRSTKSAHQKLILVRTVGVNSTNEIEYNVESSAVHMVLDTELIILDPMVLSNENDIDNNIKASFKAFKDNDRNGLPD
jgi:hypothetical protein